VGYDGIDVEQATRAGILCTNTPGVLDQSVAELTMLFVAAAARHLIAMDRTMRDRAWAPEGGIELAGTTLAIVGAGRIGSRTALMASRGFGMRVIGCRRTASDAPPQGSGFETMTSDFEAAVRDADFVCLLIPGSPENRHFLDRERLAMIPARAWLINTARGSVVDEAALYDALATQRIAGAALDVYEREPYEPVDPARDLRTLRNVILAPHVGSNTVAANRRMSERALRNVELGAAGRVKEMDLLNPDVLRGSEPFSTESA
jgi:phosphoglycerate dehydrogenase-like enzyme